MPVITVDLGVGRSDPQKQMFSEAVKLAANQYLHSPDHDVLVVFNEHRHVNDVMIDEPLKTEGIDNRCNVPL